MRHFEVTSNHKVSMIRKPKTDPAGCTEDITAMLDTLDVVGGRWTLLIVHYLITREHDVNTFKKMEKDIEGISAKMLSKELKSLEMNLIVQRMVMETKPITVQYSITPYGKNILPVIRSMVAWGKEHRMKLYSVEE